MRARKERLRRRLDKDRFPKEEGPLLRASNIHYELADRTLATNYGGIGLVHGLVRDLGLAEEIDARLHVLKLHLPYHESDHVLNLAYNIICDGQRLEDIEGRRQDEAYLNALDAERIPDPTTAGDFCRRFNELDLQNLQEAIDAARQKVWARQSPEFFQTATIDADGTLVGTNGECKQGMSLSYKGTWGYHPLLVTLANTGEELRLVNRPGNRPSHEGAAKSIDEAIGLCLQAGFKTIVLRGDTDFTQTTQLDRWHELGNVQFIFGMDVTAARHIEADDLPKTAWKTLHRPPRYEVRTKRRRRRDRVKQQVVDANGYKDIRQVSEDVAEMKYQPGACKRAYRLVIIRKRLEVRKRDQLEFFPDYRYFFYLTNDWDSTAEQIVLSANGRCQQENVLAQLHGLRALHAPVDNLQSNWAYMLMGCLAWNLKAWLALSLPEPQGRWREKHAEEKERLLRMEFRTFVNAFVRIPCQIVKTGRKIVYRLLAWNNWQGVFFRLAAHFRKSLRC
ncbi:MAG TPA: IS1380 family transposase [Pirellulales bacterium]|nr:IS1380 family transposase [Pirellulales bacterium]